MSRAARSIQVFGIYLLIAGGLFIGAPDTLISLLRLPATNEPWVHVLGVPVMALGMYYMVSARAELVPFFRATIWVRAFVLISLVVLITMGVIPISFVGFGIVDTLGAAWTWTALRAPQVAAAPAT